MAIEKEDQVMEVADVTEPAALLKLDSQLIEKMKKMCEAMCLISSFHNTGF